MPKILDREAAAARPRLRGWSHTAACVVAITLLPLMIVAAPGGWPRAAIAIYAGAVAGLFAISAVYHRVPWGHRAREIVQTIDHSMIFVTIAATYTPIAVIALPANAAGLILSVVWIGATLGVLSKVTWPNAPRLFSVGPYIAVGWAMLLIIDDVWRAMGVAGFVLLMVGGVLYTGGAIIYACRQPDPWPRWFGYHEIFHVLVIGGVAAHYVAVAFVALPKA